MYSRNLTPAEPEKGLTNNAVQAFKGEIGEQIDLRQYNTWYSTDILIYLTHLLPKHPDIFRYVFTRDISDEQQSYYKQFVGLCHLSQHLQKAVCFIATESPINAHHFIFGLIINRQMLIINPVGLTKNKDFEECLNRIKVMGKITQVYQSEIVLQKEKTKGGLFSCGPLCVELMQTISQLPLKTLLSIFECWQQSSTSIVDITELLSPFLQNLIASEEGAYQGNIIVLRCSHLDALELNDKNFSLEEQNAILDGCLGSSEQSLVFELPPVILQCSEEVIYTIPSALKEKYPRLWYKTQYLEAVQLGNQEKVQALLQEEPLLLNSLSLQGLTPLMLAISRNQKEMIGLLLSSGASLEGGATCYTDAKDYASFLEKEELVCLLEKNKEELKRSDEVLARRLQEEEYRQVAPFLPTNRSIGSLSIGLNIKNGEAMQKSQNNMEPILSSVERRKDVEATAKESMEIDEISKKNLILIIRDLQRKLKKHKLDQKSTRINVELLLKFYSSKNSDEEVKQEIIKGFIARARKEKNPTIKIEIFNGLKQLPWAETLVIDKESKKSLIKALIKFSHHENNGYHAIIFLEKIKWDKRFIEFREVIHQCIDSFMYTTYAHKVDQFYQDITLEYPDSPSVTSEEEAFINLMSGGDWIEARGYFLKEQKNIKLDVMDENGENILHKASDFLIGCKLIEEDKMNHIEALFWLVDMAIKMGVRIKLNNARYESPLHHLAYFPENKWSLELLDKLLEIARPEDLNTYDIWGKTPLLEAIEKSNDLTALKLLKHKDTDVNLFRIVPILRCNCVIIPGMSTFKAAEYLGRCKVIKEISERNDYDPDVKYVDVTTDILRKIFYGFAAQGNADTIKALLRHYGPSILGNIDQKTGWTMLHIACFSGNLDVIKILLDKNELDRILTPIVLPDEEYKNFVNYLSNDYTSAIGRTLMAVVSHKMYKKEQIKLFVRCKYFNINQIQTFFGQGLIHIAVRNNWLNVIVEMARRPDTDFMLKDTLGNTPLRLACSEGNYETVNLMAKLAMAGVNIDPNEMGLKVKVAKHLNLFKEESWFGEDVRIPNLTIDDLVKIYETGNPHKIKLVYNKKFIKLDIVVKKINVIFKGTRELRKDLRYVSESKLKRYLEYCATGVENVENMQCEDTPKWVKPALFRKILECFYKGNWRRKGRIIKLGKFRVKIKKIKSYRKLIQTPGTIYYENLIIPPKYSRSNLQSFERGKQKSFEPLMALIARKYQKIQEANKVKYFKAFSALLKFPDIQLNQMVSIKNKPHSIDTLLKGEEFQKFKKVLDVARARARAQELLPSLAGSSLPKNVIPILKELIEDEKSKGPFYVFVSMLARKVAIASIMRIHNTKAALRSRRLDALARLVEGNGTCSAVAFDGENILISSNSISANNENKEMKELIQETLIHFRNCANQEFSKQVDKHASGKALIQLACNLKELNKLNKGKREKVRTELLIPLINALYDNRSNLFKLSFEFNDEGLLTDGIFNKVLSICKDIDYLKIAQEIYKDKAVVNLKGIIKTIVRAIIDVGKVEELIQETSKINPALLKAFMDPMSKTKIIDLGDEGVHAEMRIVDYIIKHRNCSPTKRYYIGTSKLCCSHCNLIIANLHNFEDDYRPEWIEARGLHGLSFNWPVPDFLKSSEGFKRIFRADLELIAAFEQAYQQNSQFTLKLIENLGILASEKFNFYRFIQAEIKYQAHDWSTSMPDSGTIMDFNEEEEFKENVDEAFEEAFPSKFELIFEKSKNFWMEQGFNYANDWQLELGVIASFEEDREFKKQKNYLNSLNYGYVKDVPHDGFCLFHAVADQIREKGINVNGITKTTDSITTKDIIEFIDRYLQENWHNYQDSLIGNSEDEKFANLLDQLEQYLTLDRYNSDIGDLMPKMLSDALGINMVIHDATSRTEQTFGEFEKEIRLGRVNNNHYMVITNKPQREIKFENNVNKKSDSSANTVYERDCKLREEQEGFEFNWEESMSMREPVISGATKDPKKLRLRICLNILEKLKGKEINMPILKNALGYFFDESLFLQTLLLKIDEYIQKGDSKLNYEEATARVIDNLIEEAKKKEKSELSRLVSNKEEKKKVSPSIQEELPEDLLSYSGEESEEEESQKELKEKSQAKEQRGVLHSFKLYKGKISSPVEEVEVKLSQKPEGPAPLN